jgi:hypothetical protein
MLKNIFCGFVLLVLAACATPSPPLPNAASLDSNASQLPKGRAAILMYPSFQAVDIQWLPKTTFAKIAEPKNSPKADIVNDEINTQKSTDVPVSFKLTGADSNRYLLAVVEPGCHVISRMQFDPYGEWVANGGIHSITRKPLYAEICAEPNTVTYVGHFLIDTDKTGYRKYKGVEINSGLAALTYAVVLAVSPSFTDKDGQILINDSFTDAQGWLKATYPELRAPVRKRLAELGYYAGIDADEDDKKE